MRRPESEKGCGQCQEHFCKGIGRDMADLQHQPTNGDPIGYFAENDRKELSGGSRQRKRSSNNRGKCKAKNHKSCRIVDEAFSLKDCNQSTRQAHMLHHCHRRYSIGRRDDGTEHEADRPRHAEKVMTERRHGGCGEQHASDREQGDRAKIGAETAPAHAHT